MAWPVGVKKWKPSIWDGSVQGRSLEKGGKERSLGDEGGFKGGLGRGGGRIGWMEGRNSGIGDWREVTMGGERLELGE
jgi:hypothetical protein